jgi:tetratricopeptide (TPR) repeat protein
VTSINFPIEIANKPLFLARFVAGFLSYHGGRFDTALDQLNKASDAVPPDSHEIAELYYYIGACHALIAKNLDSQSKDPSADLEAMLSNFEKADAVYVRSRDSHNHGKMQLLLGNIYFSVPFPPPPDNLHKSINCFQTAATLLKGSSSRQDWANAESSLGDAYSTLFLDEEGTSWKNAVDAYNASLTVFTKAAFPSDWAAIQYHLGILYKHVRFNNLSAGLNEEIKAFESASLVFTAQDKPEQWCQMQYEIGFAWQTLSKINRDNTQPDLENAIRSYTKALNVQKAKNAYHDWAMTEFMLGLAYIDLKTGDQSENLNRARSYTIDSLTALTSANDSKLHAMGEHTLSVIDSLDRELAAAHQKSDAIH